MADAEQTKVCPLCAETIKAAAKVCPHCRHWQKKWSLHNPQTTQRITALLVVILMIAGLCVLGIIFDNVFSPKEEFAVYRNEISVVNSEFSQHMYGSNLWNTVVGTLTNQSNVCWKNVGVEAQFFDKSGKLIDVIPVNSIDYYGLIILPHGEAAFKIEGKAARPSTDYWTNQPTVRWAKDANSLF